jgi:hypothetical protein
VGGAAWVPLEDDLGFPLQVRGYFGVMGVDDHLDIARAGLLDRVDDPIDHRAAAQHMQNFRSSRLHAGAVTGGQNDGR